MQRTGLYVLLTLLSMLHAVGRKCGDSHKDCRVWAGRGECETNPKYMEKACKRSCKKCAADDRCLNKRKDCAKITQIGACVHNATGMLEECPRACGICGPGDPCIARVDKDPGAIKNGKHFNAMFERILKHTAFQKYSPRAVSRDPWLIVFDNFMSDEEVEMVKATVSGKFKRSKVDGLFGKSETLSSRTSHQAFCSQNCRNKKGQRMMLTRIEKITGIKRSRFEDTQMLRYSPGQFYSVHSDYIQGQARQACGPRILTFFVYLSDAPDANTSFPKLNLSVPARRGTAALWHNIKISDMWSIEDRTDHAGKPPKANSTKYAANVWIHNFDYGTLNDMHCFGADRDLVYIPLREGQDPLPPIPQRRDEL